MLLGNQNEEGQNIKKDTEKNIETKICYQIDFKNFLDENLIKGYPKFTGSKCCNTVKSLLAFSIIIVIFTCAGFYFSISNEGYKQYKDALEKNITLFEEEEEIPSEFENKKIVEYLNMDEYGDYDNTSCTYIEFSLSECKLANYTQYCTEERFSQEKCNYMDRQYFIGNTFICDYNNYINERCNEIQYLDEIHKNEIINDRRPLKYFNFTEYYFEKIWCKIGNYDIPIILSFFIFMILFIVSLIIDLCINKDNLIIGIKYYIVLISYMVFYFIFRAYIVLFLFLLAYSLAVCFASPEITETEDQIINLWNDKKLYAYICCGINLLLFIFVFNLGSIRDLIHKYLSLNFGENNNSEITRKASIKIGKNSYDFEIKQNKNIYLKDQCQNEKYYFKEIIYDNNTYYLKLKNKAIKAQLGLTEFNSPLVNDVFSNLVLYLKTIIFFYAFSMLILPKFHFKDDIFYKYIIHLIDLGAKPYLYGCIKRMGNFQGTLYNLIKYIFLIKGIVILLAIIKWVIYGGFSNILYIWIAFYFNFVSFNQYCFYDPFFYYTYI